MVISNLIPWTLTLLTVQQSLTHCCAADWHSQDAIVHITTMQKTEF